MKRLILLSTALIFIGCSDSKNNTQTTSQSLKQETAPLIKTKESNATRTLSKRISGKTLFAQRCKSCHGEYAQKKAMNVSQVIAGWESEKTLAAFKGYIDGTYGTKMKTLMKSQASQLKADEQKALAEYIATLK